MQSHVDEKCSWDNCEYRVLSRFIFIDFKRQAQFQSFKRMGAIPKCLEDAYHSIMFRRWVPFHSFLEGGCDSFM